MISVIVSLQTSFIKQLICIILSHNFDSVNDCPMARAIRCPDHQGYEDCFTHENCTLTTHITNLEILGKYRPMVRP